MTKSIPFTDPLDNVRRWIALALIVILGTVSAGHTQTSLDPLLSAVDMNIGETRQVELHDGTTAEVELLAVEPITDAVLDAVRRVDVTVRVNGEKKTIQSGNYNLPVTVGGVQIDAPVTSDYLERAHIDWWNLKKDARLRLWPEDSPYVWPGTFVYPVNQIWLASLTWYSNEPVDAPRPGGKIYYHAGLDLGGAEDMAEIYAATDGVVVSARGNVLPGEPDEPISPRYDVVYIRDARGWYYRYSHLNSIESSLEVGDRVRAGQQIGLLGKEGGSGGWTHLHFEIKSKQPSGEWGTQDGYAFLWQAYRREHDPEILAIARPHKILYAGQTATLTAENSWAKGEIDSYEWRLSDGSSATGQTVQRTYETPGTYSEIVKVTDAQGSYDYDFATVKVFEEKSEGQNGPPGIHATYYPTFDIHPGEKVFFMVRARGVTEGYDVWNFDDGTDAYRVKSNINPDNHAEVGYSLTSHRFDAPGDYLVEVYRETPEGKATAHLHVTVRAP